MGEGGMVDLCGVCWCLRCRLGVEWGPRCSSASVHADEGGTLVYAVVEAVEGRCR